MMGHDPTRVGAKTAIAFSGAEFISAPVAFLRRLFIPIA
jgi:hypothetical protein